MAMTWLLRPCPRCGGSLYKEKDRDHYDIVCLQCCAIFPIEVPLEGVLMDRPDRKTSFTALPKGHRPHSPD